MDRKSPVLSRREIYLTRAEEARRMAASLRQRDHQLLWEDIADDWQRMAEQLVEELGRTRH